MKEETKLDITCLKVDGGATDNNYLMQFQSDILQTTISLPKCIETTALGVSYLSGLASGYYKSLDDIHSCYYSKKQFHPLMSKNKAIEKCEGWRKAINATIAFK